MLRSKYAKPETPTYAEYIFEYKDAVYTAVSYTHLDVYKRQILQCLAPEWGRNYLK